MRTLSSLVLVVLATSPFRVHAGDPKWIEPDVSSFPEARNSAAIGYHADDKKVVMFGGISGPAYLNDTWIWTGSDWESGDTVPSPRSAAHMAYDDDSRLLIMFGGLADEAGTVALGETWSWDEAGWGFETDAGPPGRYGHAMGGIPGSGVFLFGGIDADNYFADASPNTWLWDGSSWTTVSTSSAPGLRAFAATAYDGRNEALVMHGGIDADGTLGETWSFDGSDWTLESSDGPLVSGACMVFDDNIDEVVMFGGQGDAGAQLGGTWLWDGSSWEEIDSGEAPSARSDCAMAYHARHKKSVLFGGVVGSSGSYTRLGDTWELYAKRSHYGCVASSDLSVWSALLAAGALVGARTRRRRRTAEKGWLT